MNKIKRFRLEYNLSQDELAKVTHRTRCMISRYENGKCVPKLDFYTTICDKYKLELSRFISVDNRERN